MNRAELAALLSLTMTPPKASSDNVRAQHHSLRQQSATPARRHANTRRIVSESEAPPQRPADSSTSKAQQGFIPHLQPARSYSYLPQVNTSNKVYSVAEYGGRSKKPTVVDAEELSFVQEERKAWSNRSPRVDPASVALPHPPPYGRGVTPSHPIPEIVLQPPRVSREQHTQSQKQPKHVLPLREFAPIQDQVNVEDRPKTSRGPNSFDEERMVWRASEDSLESTSTRPKSRRPRFLEGSLNEKSGAVASSWFRSNPVAEPKADIQPVATPRAPRNSHDQSWLESPEGKPCATTPATGNRRKLFKFNASIRSDDESEVSAEPKQMPKKRGLRKSLSTWNFHSLGDKLKIFGGSTTDLTPRAARTSKESARTSKSPARESDNDMHDERKRKAEEANAHQFGLKKQKSNNGLANLIRSSQPPTLPKPSSLKQRTPSSLSRLSVSVSSRTPSSTHRDRIDVDETTSEAETRKRLSRKQLEKENQHLRKMLRQSASAHFHPHQSSVHLPLNEAPAFENIPRLSQDDFVQGNKVRVLPGIAMGRRGEDVPPVPKLSREILGSLENGRNAKASLKGKELLPRSVSMIWEDDEYSDSNEIDTDPVKARALPVQMHPVKEQWEWPDDVF